MYRTIPPDAGHIFVALLHEGSVGMPGFFLLIFISHGNASVVFFFFFFFRIVAHQRRGILRLHAYRVCFF